MIRRRESVLKQFVQYHDYDITNENAPGFITVSSIELSPDKSEAKVTVTHSGITEEKIFTIDILEGKEENKYRNRLREQLFHNA